MSIKLKQEVGGGAGGGGGGAIESNSDVVKLS